MPPIWLPTYRLTFIISDNATPTNEGKLSRASGRCRDHLPSWTTPPRSREGIEVCPYPVRFKVSRQTEQHLLEFSPVWAVMLPAYLDNLEH